jgi:hypothetical protein
MFPEFVQLEKNLPAIHALRITYAEYTVPEKAYLFFQGSKSINHAESPVSLVSVKPVYLFPIDIVSE